MCKWRAFTLIELIVALSIVMIIAAGSVPLLRTFRASTELKNAAGELQSLLREAQNRAFTGDVADCVGNTTEKSLFGWAVKVQVNGTSATLHQVCYAPQAGEVTYTLPVRKTLSFPEDVTVYTIDLGTPLFVIYRPVDQGIVFASTLASDGIATYTGSAAGVVLTNGDETLELTVYNSGEITIEE